jgi:hypothetical protein
LTLSSVLDAVRVIGLLLALHGSIRARSGAGIFASVVVAYVYACEISPGLMRDGREAVSAWHGFAFVFLGPSSLPPVSAGIWPLGRLLSGVYTRHPAATHLLTAGFIGVPMWLLSRRSSKLRPETSEARSLDRAEIRFTFVLILEVILAVVAVGADYFSRD